MESLTSNETATVISRLIARGARFWAEGDRLRYSGPAGLLTDELDRFIADHKPVVLHIVAEWERSLAGLDWPLQREGDYDMDGNSCGCIN